MKIGFDLDNVFINTPPFIPDFVITKLYVKKTNGILQYRMPSKKEQLIRIASHFHLFRPGIKKNLEFLRSIPKVEHKLYLISSRFGFLQDRTNIIIKKHGLDHVFDGLYFNFDNKQPHVFKTELIKKLNLDIFVDDDIHLLKYVAGKNNKVKLFWLNKKNDKKISANITAITNIADALKKH